jgi:hypothetical protein
MNLPKSIFILLYLMLILVALTLYAFYSDMRDIYQCPHPLVQRLQHYFLTYKEAPDAPKPNHRDHPYLRPRRSLRRYSPFARGLPQTFRRSQAVSIGSTAR